MNFMRCYVFLLFAVLVSAPLIWAQEGSSQVQIETRVVETQRDFVRDFGDTEVRELDSLGQAADLNLNIETSGGNLLSGNSFGDQVGTVALSSLEASENNAVLGRPAVNLNSDHPVPVLGDTPVAGRLFRNKTKDETKEGLLVLVTPAIIPSEEQEQ